MIIVTIQVEKGKVSSLKLSYIVDNYPVRRLGSDRVSLFPWDAMVKSEHFQVNSAIL